MILVKFCQGLALPFTKQMSIPHGDEKDLNPLDDPVAKCIFESLYSQALDLGIPKAFASVYVNERVQTYLLFEASFEEADALSPYFRPLSFKALRDCPAKICVLYCARMPYVLNWSLVKDKQFNKDFVEAFLSNFSEPVSTKGPKRSLSVNLFKKICL